MSVRITKITLTNFKSYYGEVVVPIGVFHMDHLDGEPVAGPARGGELHLHGEFAPALGEGAD